MAQEQHETKLALIDAAGKLFADLGFDGASTREIARRAGTNMASIGYHFHGKENLYLEVLRHVLSEKCTWGKTLNRALELTKNGTTIYEALRLVLVDRLNEHFGQDRPVWQTKLILRAMFEPSSAMKALTHEYFVPEFTRVVEVAKTWNPGLSDEQALRWANSMFGQEMVYILGRSIILEMKEWQAYSSDYLKEVAEHIARIMSAALWPDKLAPEPEHGDGA